MFLVIKIQAHIREKGEIYGNKVFFYEQRKY